MEIIKEYRDLAEFAYFLSWPIMFLACLTGIYQIIAFRKEAKTRFRREIISNTLEILDRKIKSLDVLSFKALHQTSARKIPKKDLRIDGFCKSKVICNEEWLKWYDSNESVEFRNNIIDTLNEFETLANYIYSGIVDEDMCYSLESYYIRALFDDLAPFIALSIDEENNGLYRNLIKLHVNWTDRSLHDKTTKEHDKLADTLAKIPKPKSQKIVDI